MSDIEVTHHAIEDTEEQKIEYITGMRNMSTGAEEFVKIRVSGFNDVSAAVAAVKQFSDGLLELHAKGQTQLPEGIEVDAPPAEGQIDAELRKLLNLDR